MQSKDNEVWTVGQVIRSQEELDRLPVGPAKTFKVGDEISAEDLAQLPVGAVVDTRDGSRVPWVIKDANGWRWLGSGDLLGTKESRWKISASKVKGGLVSLDAPIVDGYLATGRLLLAWAVAHKYPCALQIAREQDAKKDLDRRPAAVQTQDMSIPKPSTMTQIEYPTLGIVCKRLPTETAEAFEARAQALSQVPTPSEVPAATTSLMNRLGASLKATGAGLGREAFDRAKVKAVHVGIDGAKLGIHKAAVAIAEAIGGDAVAVKVARVVQMPQVEVAEDFLISLGADLAGRPALAEIARQRAVERTVDGTVDLGLGVIVRAGSQVLGALTGASSAADEALTPATVAGEVEG